MAGFWAALVLLAAGCARATYPVSDHFDGTHFHNPTGAPAEGLTGGLRWKLTSHVPDWLRYPELPPGPRPPERTGQGELRVTFVNHATTLLQLDGLNVLTDPIWSQRASPLSWIGPRRVRPPGIRFEDLPPIDVVIISHDHYDHCDVPTLQRLARVHAPIFVTPLGVGKVLRDAGIERVSELDWWQTLPLPRGRQLTAVPAQHFSARGPFDRDDTLWAGYVLDSTGGPIMFAGDTAMSDHFAQIYRRFGAMRLAVLPIGAYEPRWFMKPIHVDPEEALAAHLALHAQTSVGMHFGTFQLADETQTGAQEKLAAALARSPAPTPDFWVLGFGEGRSIPALPR